MVVSLRIVTRLRSVSTVDVSVGHNWRFRVMSIDYWIVNFVSPAITSTTLDDGTPLSLWMITFGVRVEHDARPIHDRSAAHGTRLR